jgi:beta-glucanase (GH16 family)
VRWAIGAAGTITLGISLLAGTLLAGGASTPASAPTTTATTTSPDKSTLGEAASAVTSGVTGLVSGLTTTTTTTPQANNCGGVPMYKADGSLWQCTFDDEFNGTSLDTTKWTPQQTATSGYNSGDECYVDSPNNVSVSGGVLNLTARQEAAPFTCNDPYGSYTTPYTSGMVTTDYKFSQTYGLFEVSAKIPAATVAGLQTSLWLWPNNDVAYGPAWPASGEIDFAEFYSEYPNLAIPYIHYNAAAPDPNVTNDNCVISNPATQFHTYGVEWTSTSISMIYDGVTCLTDYWNPASPLVKPEPFNQPFFIALTQALGVATNAFNPATTPLPATTQIDWVRAWS